MLTAINLCKSFQKEHAEPVRAVHDVSLHVERGEFLAIVGPSGSGKSSLMNILGLLDTQDSGRYLFNGRDVGTLRPDERAGLRNRSIGFVFQQFHLLPRVSAKENVELPLLYADTADIRGLAEHALEQVGLKDRMRHTPEELSGGQQQRVAIARALVNRPDVIFADEPTGNLDSASGGEIMDLFGSLHDRGTTIVLITHDAEKAAAAQTIVRIVDGALAEKRPVDRTDHV